MATTKSSKPITKVAETMARAHQRAAEAVERMKAKEAADKKAASKAKRDAKRAAAAKQAQLPLWPEAVRAVPNAVLRGALFSVAKEREVLATRTLIASVAGIEIRFQGRRFNQTNLDLWEMLMHIARLQPLGTDVRFTAHAMLKSLGRGTGKSQHEQLKQEMMDLAAGATEITWTKERKTFVGTLISYFRDEDTGEYVVRFNKDFGKLYAKGYASIDWEQRQSLGQNNLAKWLHGFYSSHELQVYPYKVETLQRLCGSNIERLGDFRKLLRAALPKLVALGTLTSWEIDAKTDLVSITKPPISKLK
jgi:TrfA protein